MAGLGQMLNSAFPYDRGIRMSRIVLLPIIALLAVPSAATSPQLEDIVTFSSDVVPILIHNCSRCHQPRADDTLFSLLQYDEVASWADSIRDAVRDGVALAEGTIPWHTSWRNDASLSRREIATLTDWVDGGSQLGEATDLSSSATFDSEWLVAFFPAALDVFTTPPPPAPDTIVYTPSGGATNSLTLTQATGTDGDTLILNLDAVKIDALYGVAFDLQFPDDILEFESLTEGDYLADGGVATSLQVTEISDGVVVVGLSRVGEVPGRQLASGTLLTFEFSRIATGSGDFSFSRNTPLGFGTQVRYDILWFAGSVTVP